VALTDVPRELLDALVSAVETSVEPGNPSGGGSGGVRVRVFDDHWGLVELRLRSVPLCDRAFPGIRVETFGGITTIPEINASSGLIISVKIVFPYKPRDAALLVRCRVGEGAMCFNIARREIPLSRLPRSGDVWPEANRKLWLQLLEGSPG
jgi:hypothetical protein